MEAQDTVRLSAVEVHTPKLVLARVGKKYQALDSLSRRQFRFSALGEALSFNTPIFIKTYGPGGVATSSFRGGNASQTAVMWNGFNLQNAMLAQTDLSLIPSIVFDEIGVEYGSSSSLFGSGAVAGSIHLNNRTPFGSGWITSLQAAGGSFGLRNAALGGIYSGKRFVSSTRIYSAAAKNNFSYYDRAGALQTYRHAGYGFYGAMQELRFLLSPRQSLSVHAWLSTNRRDLPATEPSGASAANQRDDAARVSASWHYAYRSYHTTLRGGCFYDRIDYNDSAAEIYSKSKVQTVSGENEHFLQWGGRHEFNTGVHFSSSSATANNYGVRRALQRVSLLAGNRFAFLSRRLLLYASVRAEYFSAGALPLTANLAVDYQLGPRLVAKLNGGRIYRQPGLNELYWQPGGNPQLKPEEGLSSEGELIYNFTAGPWKAGLSGAAFTRAIDNWILWVPGPSGNPTPLNIQQVWSRGTETTWQLKRQWRDFTAEAQIITGYVLSTVVREQQQNASTLGRQLMYTPRYTVNGRLVVAFRQRLVLAYYHHYQGYRFTASDNSTWLDPYHLSSLKLNALFGWSQRNVDFFVACNNLFNRSYTVLANRPMPLRNYEIGFSIQAAAHKKISIKTNTTP